MNFGKISNIKLNEYKPFKKLKNILILFDFRLDLFPGRYIEFIDDHFLFYMYLFIQKYTIQYNNMKSIKIKLTYLLETHKKRKRTVKD